MPGRFAAQNVCAILWPPLRSERSFPSLSAAPRAPPFGGGFAWAYTRPGASNYRSLQVSRQLEETESADHATSEHTILTLRGAPPALTERCWLIAKEEAQRAGCLAESVIEIDAEACVLTVVLSFQSQD